MKLFGRLVPKACGITVSLWIAVLPTLALGAITPELVASRLAGPAPLAVHFDSSDTVIADPSANSFGDLGYRFNFGDPASGNWAFSGESKNVQIGGPVAAHVYEVPGTYTAQVEVFSRTGEKAQRAVTITVQNANVVYAGPATVCLVMDPGKATICPAGASIRIAPTSWGAFANDTRYVLAAGDDFTALGIARISCDNCEVSKIGSGDYPRLLKLIYSSKPFYPPKRNFSVIEIQAQSIELDFGENILLWRNNIVAPMVSSTDHAIYSGTTADYYFKNPGALDPSKIIRPRNIIIAENKIDGSGAAVNGMFLVATKLGVIGNEVRRPREHDIRVPFTTHSFIGHNLLVAGANSTKHNIKMHSGGLEDMTTEFYASALAPATNNVVISKNVLGEQQGDVNNWQVAVAPQDTLHAEGLRNVVVEDNRFVKNPSAMGAQRQIVMTGKYIFERGNAFTNSSSAISVGTNAQGDLMPADWKGPYFSQPQSVSAWIPSAPESSPPAPVTLTVQ